jgi:hypothetical protein
MEATMARKTLLALAAAGTLLLGGCATDPYYYDSSYGYNDGYYYDRPTYRYYGPAYYPRYYTPGPSVSLGYSYHRYR